MGGAASPRRNDGKLASLDHLELRVTDNAFRRQMLFGLTTPQNPVLNCGDEPLLPMSSTG